MNLSVFNISPYEDPSITQGLTQEAAEYEYISLLVGSSLSLDQSGDNILLLGNEISLIGNYVYASEDMSLRA